MARRCSTIGLPFDQASYPEVVADSVAFRRILAGFFRALLELFPEGSEAGTGGRTATTPGNSTCPYAGFG